jgi:hypothetical protein
MGYLEIGLAHPLRPIDQNVDIDLTIAPSVSGPSTDLLFNLLQRLQQLKWVQNTRKAMGLIQK